MTSSTNDQLLTPEQPSRAAAERNGSDYYDDGRPKQHRHFAQFTVHEDSTCTSASTRRRVYVFDEDALEAHEAHITDRMRVAAEAALADANERAARRNPEDPTYQQIGVIRALDEVKRRIKAESTIEASSGGDWASVVHEVRSDHTHWADTFLREHDEMTAQLADATKRIEERDTYGEEYHRCYCKRGYDHVSDL